jgi:4-alpha-glucanotransferase
MKLPPEKKLAGILTPLFALRGTCDLGIGDIAALRDILVWAREYEFRVVQLLPINETGNDHSPYNAISSVALDPTTVETTPGALQDLTEEDFLNVLKNVDLTALTAGPVQYDKVKTLKRALLRKAFVHFMATSWKNNDSRAHRFRAFRRAEAAWLDGYALFRVLMEENESGEAWDRWPEEQRTFVAATQWLAAQPAKRRREFTERMRFFIWVQWIAFAQWHALRLEADKLGVALMGDIPIGVSYHSADVWAVPEIFDHHWCGGAPPERILITDPFTYKWGQNWGVPLYNWEELRRRNFDWWRQRVAKVRAVFHLFRIDHVLGFYRIYAFPWRPAQNAEFLPLSVEEAQARTGGDLPHFRPREDDTPAHKAANREQGEEILHVLNEVCGEHRLIGEDLGALPDYVRPSLLSLGIAGFRVPFWEVEPDGRLIPGERYDRLSVVTYATHDHDPLRATWERWMKTIKDALDDPHGLASARDKAWAEVRQLATWAGFDVHEIAPFAAVHEKLLEALFRANSWIAVCMITDLFGTTQRFNVPGAVSAENWTSRLASPVARWNSDAVLVKHLRRVRELVHATHRATK